MVRIFVEKLLDGDKFDVSDLADALVKQRSIGVLPVSVLGFDLEERYKSLNDAEFEKMRAKHNAERDVYGICSVLRYSS